MIMRREGWWGSLEETGKAPSDTCRTQHSSPVLQVAGLARHQAMMLEQQQAHHGDLLATLLSRPIIGRCG